MDQEPFDDAQGFKLATDHENYRFMKWIRLYQVARIEMNETTSKRHLHNFPGWLLIGQF